MASTAASKKGKKKKGQTLNLSDFLSSGNSNAPDGKTVVTFKSQTSWADAMEDADDDDDFLGPTERIALPTAPRAARQEIDLSQIPDVPPYKAYVGNLSYDVDEDALENFFKDLRVNNVRLVRENGRMKGFGYVEFDDKNSLIDALKSTGQTLMARKIKVDLATQSNSRDGFGGGYGGDREGRSGNSQISGEGDADDDWRGSAAANKPSFDSGYGRHGDRDGGRYGGRRGYDERDGGFGAPRDRYGGGSEADTASSWSRGPPRSSADSSSSGYGSRRGQDNREDFGRRGHDDRWGNDDRWGHDDRGGYGGRRGHDDRNGYGSRRGYDDKDFGHGRRDGPPSGRYDNRNAGSEPPKERAKLQLAPRSKPVDSDNTVSSSSDPPKSSIFGSAKPVDTAAKEREIEERLKSQQDTRGSRDGRGARDSGSSFASRDIRTNVERRVYNVGNEPSNSSEGDKSASQNSSDSRPEQPKKTANIFGDAKPVDTAARERQIEERIRKDREEVASRDSYSDKRQEHQDAPRPNSWKQGAPHIRSDRAGSKPQKERRERQLPTSLEEMPVYKESECKDFSDANKYAGLLGSDGEDEQTD